MMVYRIFVEKKKELAHEAAGLYSELKNLLGIKNLESVRVLNRYDADDISAEIFEAAKSTVFSEPQLDIISDELVADGGDRLAKSLFGDAIACYEDALTCGVGRGHLFRTRELCESFTRVRFAFGAFHTVYFKCIFGHLFFRPFGFFIFYL
jgi:hypothetical protein